MAAIFNFSKEFRQQFFFAEFKITRHWIENSLVLKSSNFPGVILRKLVSGTFLTSQNLKFFYVENPEKIDFKVPLKASKATLKHPRSIHEPSTKFFWLILTWSGSNDRTSHKYLLKVEKKNSYRNPLCGCRL